MTNTENILEEIFKSVVPEFTPKRKILFEKMGMISNPDLWEEYLFFNQSEYDKICILVGFR